MNQISLLKPKFGRLVAISSLALIISAIFGTPSFADKSYGVESANPADRPQVMQPDIASRSDDPARPPAYGPEDAKVLIILFNDYQCPICRRASQATHQISAEFPGEVRIEVWQNPLANHSKAETAALAAIAAQQQGRFWEMHDALFQNPRQLDSMEKYAEEVGLDLEQFHQDMSDATLLNRVRRESELAVALGATGTPTFLVNGRHLVGWASWSYFRMAVERELAAANVLAESGMTPSEIRIQRALENHADSDSFELYQTAVLEPDAVASR